MGLLDFLKKIGVTNNAPKAARMSEKPEENVNSFGESWDKLTQDGDLPTGWVYRNKDFIESVSSDYSYFFNMWINSREQSPKEQYEALKSFVLHLEYLETLCKSKGECFEFWYYEILSSRDYLEKRRKELNELTTNFKNIEKDYKIRKAELPKLEENIVNKLKENDGILQSDFVKLFPPTVQDDVKSKLYLWAKDGKIEKIKSGRSYSLHYIG